METYEKEAGKVGRGLNKLNIGCTVIFANLFFAAFCLWGMYSAQIAYRLQTNGIVAEGIVIRLDESNSDGSNVYSPIIEFQAGGQSYTFDGGIASDPPAYKVGETVPVLYDPADPNTAQINKWTERWLFPIIIIPAMLFASLITTFFLIRAWRRNEDMLTH